MIYYGVHSALEEGSSLHDPITKHFILPDLEEQECTRTVVFAVFTSNYEFFGACHWTRVTQVWDILDLCEGDKGWVVYHNNQRLRHHKVSVHHGDFFACYERNDCHTPRFKLIVSGMKLPWSGLQMPQHRRTVKRHARATLQYPGSQGTYGGGMSDAPENSKNSNTVSPGSQVPH